ncbi:MAG: DEAD/DEAH box helicase [bacterium]|nr:DEAD/DEAH box helicase [bacterium]
MRLGAAIQRGIEQAGYEQPRPIQVQTIPAVLEGRDVLGLAQTGTGKTAAFVLPMLENLSRESGPGPRALIVAPTRELATQIADEIRTLGRYTRIRAVAVFGGVSQNSQVNALRRERPDILVACPGRLLDLMQQGIVKLGRIETVVLDEADHMFDMGFLPDVTRIIEALPSRRQMLLFSATMPKEIRRLANRHLDKPHVAEVEHRRPVNAIEHALYPVDEKQKLELLKHLIDADRFDSAIVFTRTKHRARRIARQLDSSGHRAVALQGNMSQNARVRAMDGFRRREFDILVATDIAARGIDVEKVSHVVNFDMPNTADAYTHRIGRTGRAECEGKAYTFVTGEDRSMVDQVELRLGSPIQRCSVEGFDAAPLRSARPAARRQTASRKPGSGMRRRRARRSTTQRKTA